MSGLGKKAPQLVPPTYVGALETLSKAALIDMVWSLAGQTVESAEDLASVIARVRNEWHIVASYRGDRTAPFDKAMQEAT